MIALGITPGVRSLAYCVLRMRPGARAPLLVDSDLLKGGMPETGDDEVMLAQRAKPHALTLGVVLERAFDNSEGTPVLMGIGPGNRKEPSINHLAVRVVLTGLAVELAEHGLAIEVLNWGSQEELDLMLGMNTRRAVGSILNQGTPLIRSRYVMAAGTALAALEKTRPFMRALRAG